MKETVLKALYFWLVLVIVIQPALSQRDYLLNIVVKSNTSYLAEKAAVQGRITNELITEIKNNLKAVGFNDSDIEITGDTSLKERGNKIDVIIKVKRPPMFVLNLGAIGVPTYYYAKTSISSEYLP